MVYTPHATLGVLLGRHKLQVMIGSIGRLYNDNSRTSSSWKHSLWTHVQLLEGRTIAWTIAPVYHRTSVTIMQRALLECTSTCTRKVLKMYENSSSVHLRVHFEPRDRDRVVGSLDSRFRCFSIERLGYYVKGVLKRVFIIINPWQYSSLLS